jgi:hypothetical protein
MINMTLPAFHVLNLLQGGHSLRKPNDYCVAGLRDLSELGLVDGGGPDGWSLTDAGACLDLDLVLITN